MKKFTFPLDRVLAWRRLQREQERAQLESLATAATAITLREQAIREERLSLERSLSVSLHFDAREVSTLAAWQSKVKSNLTALAADRTLAETKVAQQRVRYVHAERAVRLLERLRDRRLSAWQTDLDREEEAFAAEAYLARCIRLRKVDSAGA